MTSRGTDPIHDRFFDYPDGGLDGGVLGTEAFENHVNSKPWKTVGLVSK
jgi:hypothetical protein